jgi:hypothetical protein
VDDAGLGGFTSPRAQTREKERGNKKMKKEEE